LYIQINVTCDEPSQLEAAEKAFRDLADEVRAKSIAGSSDHQVYVQLNANSFFQVGGPENS
jgi:hypothetical protein